LAGHGHTRQPAGGSQLHRHLAKTPGIASGLPRGNCLSERLDHRRASGDAGGSLEECLRPVPALPAEVRPDMPYTVTNTELPEVLILEPKVFSDDRGFFFESFNQRDFHRATGLDV